VIRRCAVCAQLPCPARAHRACSRHSRPRAVPARAGTASTRMTWWARRPTIHRGDRTEMADKSPRQHQSKKSGKSLKEKRSEKKAKQDPKRAV